MINTLWFLVLAAMLVGYAILDGFDLGVGILHLGVARRDEEREAAINAIGPVWNGNEVWLIAAGGAMVAAFPHLYAAAFSGFYLALMIVLWLLILRGVAIEFRHQVDNPLWREAWDTTFSASSALLAMLFGVAVGNVLRGVPLDAAGSFRGSFTLLLNPFAVLCGVLSLFALGLHGAAYLAVKTEGALQRRARQAVLPLWGATITLLAAVVAASIAVRPDFTANFSRWPLLALIPAAAIAAAAGVARFRSRGLDSASFLSSGALIAAVLGAAAAGLYPRLLPSLAGSTGPSLDIYNSASSARSMTVALGICLAGMAIVVVYLVNVYRVWRGKVREGDGYHP
jgi:cytochrome bd ubiquinol oxidase subunit II